MKKLILLIFTFSLGVFSLKAQTDSAQIVNWDKIIIQDSYGGWYSYNNIFQIDRVNLALTTIEKPDSIIKIIEKNLIDELFNSLKSPEHLTNDPLLIFGKDSLWLIDNAEQLWKEYKKEKKTTKEIDSIAINAIKDYKNVKKIVRSLQGSHWTDDYPFTGVSIITGLDTTLVTSSVGQYPFMTPWLGNNGFIYNHNIPRIIGEILPNNIKSNKYRLLGKNFNHHLIDKIYRSYIRDKEEFIIAKNKYPNRFKSLSNHFEVIDAELTMMSSIEWGGFLMGANCLEIYLKDSTVSNNIQFSTVFGRRIFLHPTKPLIRKKEKILERLKGNPVYEYCIKTENCLGEIHFVNHKSLSNEAKRAFLSDVKDNGLNKSKYKRRFKNAIFFELSEFRDNKRSFSRWIFLNDGTLILWQLNGKYLMDLPENYSKNNGYICKQIKRSEI
jgi:hypothetical protein